MDAGLRPTAHRDTRTPRRLHWLYAVAALALTGLGHAGQIYKSVGPDGKITYSDRPPAGKSTDVTQSLHEQDPGLKGDPLKAALNVYTKEIIVETLTRFCAKQAPQSASSVQAARDEWMQRHAVLRQKKIVVLHDRFSSSELVALAHRMEQLNEGVLRTFQQSSVEERQKVCAEAPQKFTAPEFNLTSNRDIVDALVNYRAMPKN